jgi:chemotaxis protein methyltransferase CheR
MFALMLRAQQWRSDLLADTVSLFSRVATALAASPFDRERTAKAFSQAWLSSAPEERNVAVDVIAAAMQDTNVGVRTRAVETISWVGVDALRVIGKLLQHTNTGVRRMALDAAVFINDKALMPGLLTASVDPHAAVRAAAVEAIARIDGNDSVPWLMQRLSEEADPTVVLAVLIWLDQLAAELPADVLEKHLAQPLTAPSALQLLGRSGHTAQLYAARATPSPSRRRAAVVGLGHAALRMPLTFPATVRALLFHSTLDADTAVAGHAAVALAAAGEYAGVVMISQRKDHTMMLDAAARCWALLEKHDPDAALLVASKVQQAHVPTPPERRVGKVLPFETSEVISIPLLRRIAAVVHETSGLQLGDTSCIRVSMRLRTRLKETGCANYDVYAAYLEDAANQQERLAAVTQLTIHETYFFRESTSLSSLEIEFQRRHARGQALRVWNPGCSTGEEPYTVAMLMEASGVAGTIDACDISPAVIEQAHIGVYKERSFREAITSRFSEYFEKTSEGLRVIDSIRKRVVFRVDNLVDERILEDAYDVILCRNVMMYFSMPVRERLVSMFNRMLKPGGILVLGHSELLMRSSPFAIEMLGHGVVFRKPTSTPPTPVHSSV